MLFLQMYQLMEFLMCIGIDPNIIGRFGLIVITFLPPLGILLISSVCKLRHWINWSGIVAGIALSIYYSIVPDAFSLQTCNPFYAIYNYPLGNLYGFFYFGYIFWAFILIIIAWVRDTKENPKQLNRKAIYVLIGYFSFLLPMAITIIINFSAVEALESIMCKYALFLAITLFIFSFQYERNSTNHEK
ncbi:MAG: hypothetical protein JW776_13120 [Candidatus Lokiarchaeota archaeon]|nr:hypothetical protein [Candidatus Lokiarchaeota archaeon]